MNSIDDDRSASVSDIRISSVASLRSEEELQDDEIKKLTEYFQKGRDEIQKKVNSLLNFDFSAHIARNLAKSESSASLKSQSAKSENKKYRPIDLETAIKLRLMSVGSVVHSFSNEWKKAKFVYRSGSEDLMYGLCTEKNGSRGLILSVQTVLLKNLILMGYRDINGKEVLNSEWRNKRKILQPNESEKRDALVRALVEILWIAGENESSTVVLNGGLNCFDTKIDESNTKYFMDGLTERLHIYEFKSIESLEEFVRKNLSTVI